MTKKHFSIGTVGTERQIHQSCDSEVARSLDYPSSERLPMASLLLTSLFPKGVVAAEMRTPGDPTTLWSDEGNSIKNASERRAGEFSAGRLCARHALRQLGITPRSLPVGPDRRPQWPAGAIGSITHTTDFYGAVAAFQSDFKSVGVDVEAITHVTADVHLSVCHSREYGALNEASATTRQQTVALIFSAKEAFYKCQYALTKCFLEFKDVILDLKFEHPYRGSFSIHVLEHSHPFHNRKLTGSFLFDNQYVMTGVAIPR